MECKSTFYKGCSGAFPQCAELFQHCRPVILVDATFLMGKYKGPLMMAVAVDPERQLVPLAFALTEEENNDSWSLYLKWTGKEFA